MVYVIYLFIFFQDSTEIQVFQRFKDEPDIVYEFERDMIQQTVDLYNSKYKDSLTIKFTYLDSYKSIFDTLKNKTNHSICGLSAITITDKRDKQYDFSIPYIPIVEAVIGLKKFEHSEYVWKGAKGIVRYKKNTMHQETAEKIAQKFGLMLLPFNEHDDLKEAIGKEHIVYIGDISDTWSAPYLKLVEQIDEGVVSHYGIMYPEGSKLKKKLDLALTYFVRSPKYYALLKKYFGKGIIQYYQEVKNRP